MARNYNRSTIPHQATASAYLRHLPAKTGRGLFTADEYRQVRTFFDARPELKPTPLHHMPALARALGVGQVLVKDETGRFGLNAFKLLGARFAIETLRAEGSLQPGQTVVCASEGNHGRAVARAAREAGCAARVYMAADAAPSRVDAIAGEGATVIRVSGSYDDAVRMLGADAAANGWTIVSDTSWEGYERIPRLIMLGYTRMMDEMIQAMPDDWRPTPSSCPAAWEGCWRPSRPERVALAQLHISWPSSPRLAHACRRPRAGQPTTVRVRSTP
jgi:threonine dehydratase